MSPVDALSSASPMAKTGTARPDQRHGARGALVACRMDLFAISSSMRRYLLTIVPLSIVLGVLVNSVSEAGVIGSLVLSAAIMATQWDGQAGWESFKASLPISRRQTAAGRYLAMLVFGAVDLALVLAISAVIWAIVTYSPFGPLGDPVNLGLGLEETISASLMTYLCLMLCTAAILPLLLRFGTTDSLRWIVLLSVVFAIAIAVFFSGEEAAGVIGFISSLGEWVLLALCAAVTAGAWLASYLVARAWYVRKRL